MAATEETAGTGQGVEAWANWRPTEGLSEEEAQAEWDEYNKPGGRGDIEHWMEVAEQRVYWYLSQESEGWTCADERDASSKARFYSPDGVQMDVVFTFRAAFVLS